MQRLLVELLRERTVGKIKFLAEQKVTKIHIFNISKLRSVEFPDGITVFFLKIQKHPYFSYFESACNV